MIQYSIKGCLFDSYHSIYDNTMTFWIKQLDHNNVHDKDLCICIKDTKWKNYFYVVCNNYRDDNNSSYFQKILQNDKIMSFIASYEYVKRQEKITDNYKIKKINSKVLKMYLLPSYSSPFHRYRVATMIEKLARFQQIRLYNVDLLSDQQYFFDNDIFPFGLFEVYNREEYCLNNTSTNEDSVNSCLVWSKFNNDSIESIDYQLPSFKNIHLSINFPKGKITQNEDELKSITLRSFDFSGSSQQNNTILEEITGTEKDVLNDLNRIVQKIDPDFVFTDDGDSLTFPYLINRAKENNVGLYLGRDKHIPVDISDNKKEGTTYFSYGRMYYRPSPVRLYGRIHIDLSNSFLFGNGSNIEGLFEISRLCRIPLHFASRVTIGRCLTSLHQYTATKRRLLIPWKPVLSEHPKTLRELLTADRGGMTLEPELGVHEKVAEFDFISLYPNIMVQKNISAETILCECCFHTSKSKVPELGYHICKEKGLVSESLEIVLRKRMQYKNLKKNTQNTSLKQIYDQRQSALKWILVTSFGYLGFNNAKFGRIDAHIAVCAFAREILLKTIHMAEESGFDVLHGIVDSIWIKKENTNDRNCKDIDHKIYEDLKVNIEKKTGFKISFEGIYKWIAFMPSKTFDNIGVVNRYFGVFENGTIKVRGIETRRHDTPLFISKCQDEVLEIMAKGDSIKQVKELFPVIKKKVDEYILKLRMKEIKIDELVFVKKLSKDVGEYKNRKTLERSALKQLEINKYFLKKGQTVRYIITEYHGTFLKRTTPLQLIDENTIYDIQHYCKLLLEAVNILLQPFGIPIRKDMKSLDSKIMSFVK